MASFEESLLKLAQKVENLAQELKEADDEIEKKADLAAKVDPDAVVKEEIELLKKTAPGMVEMDDGLQYFLAVGEMQRTLEELKTIKRLEESQLDHLLDEIQMLKNLQYDKSMVVKKYEEMIEKGQINLDADNEAEKKKKAKEDRKIESDIRVTKLIYKELKKFLGEILIKVSATPESPVAVLLQHLWDEFWVSKNKDSSKEADFLDVSKFKIKVDPAELESLVRYGVVERDDSGKKIRMVDFTEDL